ncbi:alpha/beta fold hydrolase [Breznakia pachnodae]|uniref:Pimeloyl-ACP methyl ester carboxylesterase n=1 Tax=Breznakia pachnodae TaxID=265178 RepID=A0ABU0DZY0_9FIRM|nr:alpha/beta hydrolase [Breznakia pachnodae]MDQ0360105.1 pimeloyl-ACP methyl ester carboxylesterase [Breznakia pachnodae]
MIIIFLESIFGLMIMIFTIYFILTRYKDPYHKKVIKAGFKEYQVQIGKVNFNYAEGPNNGPALLLLHAQHMDWYSYSRVLPKLSKSFHIFAVDYHGHGKTSAPSDYMNANQIGNDLVKFIQYVIQKPVYVSGNSSGGVLTAWLATNAPELVNGIVLEDPALLSSEYPRILDTIADKSFSVCSDFIQDHTKHDFLLYWIEQCKNFFKERIGFNVAPLLANTIKIYRRHNLNRGLEIIYLPVMVRLMIRGMNYYDPHFGAAFHDGSWNKSFNHSKTLSKIKCPSLLLHANFKIQSNGILNGAIDQEEANQIIDLIPNSSYLRIDSQHVVHIDKSDQYIEIVTRFFNEKKI